MADSLLVGQNSILRLSRTHAKDLFMKWQTLCKRPCCENTFRRFPGAGHNAMVGNAADQLSMAERKSEFRATTVRNVERENVRLGLKHLNSLERHHEAE
jgi:hypothetical protein